MGIPLKLIWNPWDLKNIPTPNLNSYNLRPQRELEAHIRWLCSPGAYFKIVGTDFYFFDFFAENFWFLKIWNLENPKIPPKHHYGKPYSNHRVLGGYWVRICKKWRHLEPLRRSGGALGGARAPVTQKSTTLSIPATQRAVQNVSE